MTLKEFLNDEKIILSKEDRFKLGYRIARIFDSKKMGEKKYTQEDGFKVRVYPYLFLISNTVIKYLLKFIKKEVSNG